MRVEDLMVLNSVERSERDQGVNSSVLRPSVADIAFFISFRLHGYRPLVFFVYITYSRKRATMDLAVGAPVQNRQPIPVEVKI